MQRELATYEDGAVWHLARLARQHARIVIVTLFRLRESASPITDRSGSCATGEAPLYQELRAIVFLHTRAMIELGIARYRVIEIISDIVDTATRDVVAEFGHGIWPRGTTTRNDCVRWTCDAYGATESASDSWPAACRPFSTNDGCSRTPAQPPRQ